jgi:menaquinol-cytochrome c reductase iron-sulfur subunit
MTHILHPGTPEPPRRKFFVKLFATLIGGLITAVPVVSGLWVFTDPLRRKSRSGDDTAKNLVRVTTLESIPDDGVPRLFAIVQNRVDAWNLYKNESVGSVYITRKPGSNELQVLSTTCPHLGCAVSYSRDSSKFQCPCHNSAFELDGEMIQPSPSPRRLDELSVKLVGEPGKEEVWVEYLNFKTGIAEKEVRT